MSDRCVGKVHVGPVSWTSELDRRVGQVHIGQVCVVQVFYTDAC